MEDSLKNPEIFQAAPISGRTLANSGTGTVSILLGNGDGSFQGPQNYAAGFNPHCVTVGDFNGDGIPDLVVAAGIADSVRVLLGNGDGTFQEPLSFAAGNRPNSLAVGDFNGDGKLDIVTTNFAVVGDPRHPQIIENGVRVLLGNGDGTFQTAQAIAIQPSGSRPNFVVVGDFNGDGKLDLAVANAESGALSIFLGKGDGTFQPARTYDIGYGLVSLAVGDFNGDGHLDVVAGNVGTIPAMVTILLGKGDGTFQAARKYRGGVAPSSLAVADFNGDGIPDLAAANSDGTVSLLLGNGDGSFQAAQSYAGGSGGSLVVADFNGDGLPDLALSNSATILLNQP